MHQCPLTMAKTQSIKVRVDPLTKVALEQVAEREHLAGNGTAFGSGFSTAVQQTSMNCILIKWK